MAKSNQGYKDENYDRLAIWLKKGKRDEYKAAAAEYGLGYAEMIRLAVEEFIANHDGEVVPPLACRRRVQVQGDALTAEQRRLVDAAEQLPADARKQLLKFLTTLVTEKNGGNAP